MLNTQMLEADLKVKQRKIFSQIIKKVFRGTALYFCLFYLKSSSLDCSATAPCFSMVEQKEQQAEMSFYIF